MQLHSFFFMRSCTDLQAVNSIFISLVWISLQ